MTLSPQIAQLLSKYDVPGPRYTSYPTVPYWERTPTEAQWIEHVSRALDEATAAARGAGIYIHIPFCESLCTYCGCNTRITRKHEVGLPYVDTVLAEWEILTRALGRDRPGAVPLSELHLGGGTPTFLSSAELGHLLEGVLARCDLTSDAELSVEADPRVTRQEQLATLRALGFTRLSLGVQDFDPRVQFIIHRMQSVAQVERVTADARALGYTSVGYDLVYGLPLQTLDGLERTLEAVIRLGPDRIAFYGYAHVPWVKKGQRRFTEADLPETPLRQALYQLGRMRLEAAGYRDVGMDHFARPSDPLAQAYAAGTMHRNFMGYTTRRVEPLIGLGVSAIGDAWTAFAQNEKVLEDYRARVLAGELPIARGHVLDDEDVALRRCILDLMTRWSTTWPEGRVPFLDAIGERLAELRKDGLVTLGPGHCEVTERGRTFVRNVCMAFDARLARRAPETQIFSRTL